MTQLVTAVAEAEGLMGALALVDRRATAWCLCQCARTGLHLVFEGEDRPRLAIEATEGWVRGARTEQECQRAAVACANAAYDDAPNYFCTYAPAVAATFAATGSYDAATVSTILIAMAVEVSGASREGFPRKHSPYAFLSSIRWPLTTPTPDQLRATPPAVRVAWDLVATDPRTDHPIPDLIEAHARTVNLALDWADPVQRAVAERADDEDRVRALLGAVP